ncbi:hypothetical protein [Vibrio parahaemolyticus]|uniref:hypothetical protein n=1 Tax=Vibrio parahaemolyticus TaxID=670 RepID=UPI0010DF31EB|nr:hypothetical protein [Vibrio parahaemolyticus]MBE4480607.1 hypothetical protein [Vibrio parahaemolyticus]MCX4122142.1 hypothetical protein [Vibrio parahaemolyticus]TBT37192.1 hypothetical protein D5E79_25585 [Vibrio parahaemolyticus]TNZ79789.1 hypothetical protein CGK39_23640 [Vibrio parahaemolyticus]TOZ89689.1 hypothetical protein DXE04_24630 [Vibrio parahaemolyticus]
MSDVVSSVSSTSVEDMAAVIAAGTAMFSAVVALTSLYISNRNQKRTLNQTYRQHQESLMFQQNSEWIEKVRNEVSIFCWKTYEVTSRFEVCKFNKIAYPETEKDRLAQFEVEQSYHNLLLLVASHQKHSQLTSVIEEFRSAKVAEWCDARDKLINVFAQVLDETGKEVLKYKSKVS